MAANKPVFIEKFPDSQTELKNYLENTDPNWSN